MSSSSSRSVFVTGGNSGIGLALCKQLATEDGCRVFMGSRSLERGRAAAASLGCDVEVVQCDLNSAESIRKAAGSVGKVFGLVNNAGCGLAHGLSAAEIIETNYYGTVAVTDAFLPLLDEGSHVVHVGSGAGPMWLAKQSEETKAFFTKPDVTPEEIDGFVKNAKCVDPWEAYGLSKAALAAHATWLSKAHPHIISNTITPGFIDTAIVKGFGATKPPEEGTVSIRHCLFGELPRDHNGWFYGSDAKPSPFYPLRNPGDPVFTGSYPWSK
ncbi:hypothetical protein CTAYLR_005415 [Chrysophaeum taylorii]|uniref:NAD(P)-binding protein n=1 Tax=Chrysophaeum taylorii TaxID=2483200 RepID=A0AAD7XIQ3_9STRA|nr:hypothetical protein CTAYLR_005415 [Chrysophaeum taylorii]